MRSCPLIVAIFLPLVATFSFNAWDLGFHGIYPRQHFHSVDFEAPAPRITRWDSRCDTGNLLLTPRGPSVTGLARGPVMLDSKGNLIWMDGKRFEQAMNLNVQQYKGQDYLTFWTKQRKNRHAKHSQKSYIMLDSSYEIVHKVTPHGHGLKGDSHEFRITPQGTALITIYKKHQADCTDLHLGKNCWIQDGLFQEIDIETGDLLFEWRATDHISMKDVYSSPCRKDGYGKSKEDAFDFFHINSVDKIDSGDYIISARYMHAVVCVSAKTGEVLWQLGGKNNNFEDLNGATKFAWQHHVTWQGNNTLSLFDNHANNVFHSPSRHSKGMLIQLNLQEMTALLLQAYVHPDEILNVSQGSVQLLPESGNVLVGFGNSPSYIEFSADGKTLCSAHFAPHLIFQIIDFGFVKSYRTFKSPWVGRPKTVPDVKVKHGRVYVSWNGATEVKTWRLETAKDMGPSDDDFETIQELERDGFETGFELNNIEGYVRIGALDAVGDVMAYSAVVSSITPSSVWPWVVLSLLSGILAVTFLSRRSPRLWRLRSLRFKLFNIGTRFYATVVRHQPCDYESEPLMLDRSNP